MLDLTIKGCWKSPITVNWGEDPGLNLTFQSLEITQGEVMVQGWSEPGGA